jgi:D-alanine transaminase
MSRVAYVNGRYMQHLSANVHIEDRGFQFADGVYEVVSIRKERLVDLEMHLDRLNRSLFELRIPWPTSRRVFNIILKEIVQRNRVINGSVYVQITRGTAAREFSYPKDLKPSFIIYTRKTRQDTIATVSVGHKVISKPDIRWKRCDIKTISLLPAVMAKQAAVEAEAIEAWLVNEQGMVTEGTSSNAWIITLDDEIITRHIDNAILSGVTRNSVLKLAQRLDLVFVERAFSLNEAMLAKEAFCTSSTALVKPIVQIDKKKIGEGKVGPITKLLIENYLCYVDTHDEKD